MSVPDWFFVVKKRLSWLSEMLQVTGTAHEYFLQSLGLDFEVRNAKMALFSTFLDEEEWSAFDELIEREQRRNPLFLEQLAERAFERCSDFALLGLTLEREEYASKSDEALLGLFDTFYEQALLMVPVAYCEPNLTETIKSQLSVLLRTWKKPELLDEYFLALTSTDKELTVIREQRDLLRIASHIQEQPDLAERIIKSEPQIALEQIPIEICDLLRRHVEEFSWINTDDILGNPWTEIEFVIRLQYLLRMDCKARLQAAIERDQRRKAQQKILVAELKIEGNLLRLIEAARVNSHLRTHCTEVSIRTFYQASRLLSEMAHRIGLEYSDVRYLSLDELRRHFIVRDAFDPDELERRRRGMAYLLHDRRLQTFFGAAARKFAAEQGIGNDVLAGTTQIQGVVANKGVARGLVRVVSTSSDLDKVQGGDILVVSMTNAEFAPAIERAAAFVTDEGGITCHAAILSREMDVPCITSTEIATQVLKDGDFVEVDATQGVVRNLSLMRP